MKIKIKSYNEEKNQYESEIGHVQVQFNPFVSGFLNGEKHDREIIDRLIGQELDLDLFQATSGVWLLTGDGDRQFEKLLEGGNK